MQIPLLPAVLHRIGGGGTTSFDARAAALGSRPLQVAHRAGWRLVGRGRRSAAVCKRPGAPYDGVSGCPSHWHRCNARLQARRVESVVLTMCLRHCCWVRARQCTPKLDAHRKYAQKSLPIVVTRCSCTLPRACNTTAFSVACASVAGGAASFACRRSVCTRGDHARIMAFPRRSCWHQCQVSMHLYRFGAVCIVGLLDHRVAVSLKGHVHESRTNHHFSFNPVIICQS